MVAQSSSFQTLEDLANAPICFSQARSSYLALEDRFAQKRLEFQHMGYEEDVEFLDTYNVQRCKAAVGEATELAMMRLHKGVNKIESRILAEPLSVFPIFAATPTQDAQWLAAVAWVVHFVQAAERTQTAWRTGGANALALKPQDFPFGPDWRKNVLAATGDYGAIYARTLGEQSPFKLPRGVNAPWSAGGLLAPPVAE